jgi:hypothetical protein
MLYKGKCIICFSVLFWITGLSFSMAYTEAQIRPHYDVFIDSAKKLIAIDVIQKFNSGNFNRPEGYVGLAEAEMYIGSGFHCKTHYLTICWKSTDTSIAFACIITIRINF